MKDKLVYLKEYIPWLLVILTIEIFTAIILWIADIEIFISLIGIVFLFTIICFFSICYILIKREIEKETALRKYLLSPTVDNENKLITLYGKSKKDILKELSKIIENKDKQIRLSKRQLEEYEDYVEVWAHEIKVPLSLLILLLDNRNDLSDDLKYKLDYIRNQMQQNVSQILFYHRTKGDKKDYIFKKISLKEILTDVLEDYDPLLREKNFNIKLENINCDVFTDKRSIEFILGQVLNNAIKYSGNSPELVIQTIVDSKLTLSIKDNGVGVKACDLPYIFEKGFAGDSGVLRKKSSGMGLYLVKKIADDINIDLQVYSEYGNGFEIKLLFELNNSFDESVH